MRNTVYYILLSQKHVNETLHVHEIVIGLRTQVTKSILSYYYCVTAMTEQGVVLIVKITNTILS